MRLSTQQHRIALLSSLMATVFLSACGGGDESDAVSGSFSTSESAVAEAIIGDTHGTLESAAAVTPTSTGTWTKIANEWGYFTLSTSQYVRYGAGTKWVGKYIKGKAQCINATFGSDPVPGVTKRCDVYKATTSAPAPAPSPAPAPAPAPAPSPAPAPAPANSTALLTWSAPTGSVAGYRVYYGTASRSYQQVKGSGLYVTNTTYTVPSLTSGKTYYFAVTAIDASGKESPYSTEAKKVMP